MQTRAYALAALLLAACASHVTAVPANATFGEKPSLPAPERDTPKATPRIQAIWLSGNDVRRGADWSGEIVTSTNVASVEVRTNLFSIDVPRRAFGRFAFRLHVFDVPPIFVRAYDLRVIARNAAGAQAEEDLPFRIR